MSIVENGAALSLDEKRALLAKLLRENSKKARSAPLSFAQQRLWFLDRLEPGNPFYNMPQATRLSGALNIEALEQALQAIVSRHESLRTTFSYVDGSPIQLVSKDVVVTLPVNDLTELPEAAREAEARRLASDEAMHPFNLSQGPLLRASLLRLANEDHVLLLTIHHIVSDGWSSGILFRELGKLYKAFIAGKPSPLAELKIQYSDYAVWQRDWLQGDVLEKQLAYWKEHLEGDLPVLELPTDRPRPAIQTFNGAHRSQELSKQLSEQLKALSQREGVTLYMLLLAAFQVLLSRYSGREEIIVGSPIAGRNRTEIEGLIGFFVNTLVMRTDLSGNPTFRELLRRVKEVALGAYAHQDLPFEKLVEELQPERSLSHSPLFQVMFALQNAPGRALELAGLHLRPFSLENKTTKFDLEMHVWERRESLTFLLFYNTDLFDDATAQRILGHYQRLMEGIVADLETPISDLPLLTEGEQNQLLVEWNNTGAEYPRDKCIHQLFEEQVTQRPDDLAVIFKDEHLTYRQLNEKANRLAHYLGRQGVGPEVVVAVYLERSIEMVVSLLGIMKAGGAFLPIDSSHPAERTAFLIKDSRAQVVLTQQRLWELLPATAGPAICVDTCRAEIASESTTAPACAAIPDNAAYIVYTSGSTGTPKGSVSPHYAWLNRFAWMWRTFPFAAGELGCQRTSFSFADSIWETFGPLLRGVPIVIISDDTVKDPHRLVEHLSTSGVTRLVLVPSLLRALLERETDLGEKLPRLKYWTCSGEALPFDIVRLFKQRLPKAVLLNLYGSSEVAADVTFQVVDGPVQSGSIAIGRPIDNSVTYILDSGFQPVPVGVCGELYVAGAGLSRGYLDRPELTAEKFLPNPFSDEPGARMFRTGDLAHYREDGTIDYMGRKDYQVKIRGFRVEPGEVESVLRQHPSVRESAVVLREDIPGDRRLVAYVVPIAGAEIDQSEFRAFLQKRLPDYMIPAMIVELAELPLTTSGKVNRLALPAPEQYRPELGKNFVPPRTLVEQTLAAIWCEVLKLKQVGINDNFFELGGHSLLAVRLFAQIEKTFGKNLPLATLFQAPTIEHLAGILRQEEWVSSWSSLVPIKPGGSKPAIYFVHPRGGNVLCYRVLARLLGPAQPVYALQAQGLDGKRPPHATLEEMAAHYLKEIRALQPEGPYYLGGASSGGILAFEMAQQLHAQRQKVGVLVLIDTFFPGFPRYLPNRTLFRSKLHRALMRGDLHLGYLLMLKPAGQLKHILDGLRRIGKNLKKKIVSRFSAEDPLRRTIRAVREVNERAFQRYKPKVYPGRITYFWCVEMMSRPYIDNRLGWDVVAEGGLDVHMVPGSHTALLDREEHTRVLAAEINNCLERSQALASLKSRAMNEDIRNQAA